MPALGKRLSHRQASPGFRQLLDRLVNEERKQPNDRLKDVIANHESTIDRLSDLRTESNAYWHPEPECEPRGGRDE